MNKFWIKLESILTKITGILFALALHLFAIGCFLAALKWVATLIGVL